jgi:hypothetical protein
MRVHQRLKAGRAMTLCCKAKRPRTPASIRSAVVDSPPAPGASIDFGTSAFSTNPIA